jgi:lysine-specific demethylase/histidyl-hydroxylase NO66
LPLHVGRSRHRYFSEIYTVSDVEESLVSGSRELEQFALVRSGSPQAPLDAYVITRPAIRGKSMDKAPVEYIDHRKVIALFERGYTLIIKDAGLLTARLQRVCNRLQNDLGAYVGANVYFTPAGTQGFELHHDSHDTLTVQIEGTKTWRIYEPAIDLPLESQPLNAETADSAKPALTLHREVTLAAGDTLYLPRGYAHEAVANGNRALHVTFALAPVRAIDLMHAIIDRAALDDKTLRRALPFGWQIDPAFAATFTEQIAPRLPGIFRSDAVATATQVAVNGLFAASRSDASGAFDQLGASMNLAPDSVLRMNENLPILLRERATAVDVMVPGKSLGLPKLCMPTLERLQAGPVRFGDLDLALSEADRLFFVKTLILEGVLLVDAKTRSDASGT